MKWKPGAVAFLCAAAWCAGRPAYADETCELQKVAKLDMTPIADGRITVPMTIEGQSVDMLVDTGGLVSMLTPQAVAALKLQPMSLMFSRIRQYGGLPIDHYVVADDIRLGTMKADRLRFLVMPGGGYPPDIGGLLAPEIMHNYDVDLDFANATLNFFSQDHCEGRVVYWTHEPYGEVDVSLNQFAQIHATVTVDGKDVRATIDTGASHSVASLEEMERLFDFDEDSPALKRLTPPGAKRRAYRYPFKTLSLQSISVSNPDIVLIPNEQSKVPFGEPKMLLGIDILRRLHLYIAYREGKLYVTSATAH